MNDDFDLIRKEHPETENICLATRIAKDHGVRIYKVKTWNGAHFIAAVVDGNTLIYLKELA